MTFPRMARRHFCPNRASSQCGGYRSGSGRGKCRGCGTVYVTQQGWYGVFVWSGRGVYRVGDAIKAFSTERAAESFITRDETYVVRWIPA